MTGAPGDIAGAVSPAPVADATVRVATDNPYDVVIGHGLDDRILGALAHVPRVAILHAPPLHSRAAQLTAAASEAGAAVVRIELPDAEAAKTVDVLAECWARFAAAGLDRTSVVVGMGGGSVTDVAGFAAATYMRGIGLIQVPTTVLGMVDAAVGGKTGINTAAGKNMVGSFYEPRLVVADLNTLDTLPRTALAAGLAEITKCGFIADPEILRIIEAESSGIFEPSSPALAEVIRRGVAVKADVVAADLRESSLREILNYGHTLAHAIELRENYRWQHGNAVAVGMVFVAELARAAGRLDDATADRHRAVLRLLGLPTGYDTDALEELTGYMAHDKKTRAGQLRFVVLDALAKPGRLEAPDPALLQRAYAAMNGDG